MKYRLLLLVCWLLASTVIPASAQSSTSTSTPFGSYVTARDIYVRGGPGEGFLPVGRLVAGDLLFPLNRSVDARWVLIRYNRGFGWVRADLGFWIVAIDALPTLDEANLTPTPLISETPTPAPTGVMVDAGKEGAYVRFGPSQNFPFLGAVVSGDYVEPVGRSLDGEWLLIRFRGGFGWISRRLVDREYKWGQLPVLLPDALTPSATFTPSLTPTASHTPTPSLTPTASPTPTLTLTPSHTPTPTFTPTASPTPTLTLTPSHTPTLLPPPTNTLVPTAASTEVLLPTITDTSVVTLLPSAASTSTPPPTATDTPTETQTSTPTATDTPPLTETPEPTATNSATAEPTATDTPTLTATATFTALPTLTSTPTDTATLTDTPTSTPTAASSDTPTPEPSAANTAFVLAVTAEVAAVTEAVTTTATPTNTLPTLTSTPTDTATPAPSNTPTRPAADLPTSAPAEVALLADATDIPAVTATPEPTATPTDSATATPTDSATPEPTATSTATAPPTSSPTATLRLTDTLVPPTDDASPTATASPVVAGGVIVTGAPPTPVPVQTAAPGAPRIPSEALVGGALLVAVLVYVVFYWRGLASTERYAEGFVIERCPVCKHGHLTVETRQDRFLGIPRPRSIVRCDNCRSVLREVSAGHWRYAVDSVVNGRLYNQLNGRVVDEEMLETLERQTPTVRPSANAPAFIDDEE